MDDNDLGPGIGRERVVGPVPEPRATQAAGGEHQPGLAEVGVGPRRRHQLATMMGIHRLAGPAHCVGGTEEGEELIVVQDQLHQDTIRRTPRGLDGSWSSFGRAGSIGGMGARLSGARCVRPSAMAVAATGDRVLTSDPGDIRALYGRGLRPEEP